MITPISNYIVVKPSDEKTKTQGSLIIVEHKEQSQILKGTVTATGKGKKSKKNILLPMTVKIGDTVYFNTQSQGVTKMNLNDQEHFILPEDDVCMILE